jgi:hypothetical protein
MKRIIFAGCLALGAGVAWTATMRPSAVVYGDLRDAYGIRLSAGASVSAFSGSNEVARVSVGTYPRGVNYKLAIDVYDSLTAQPGQVTPGDPLVLRVKVGAQYQPLIGNVTLDAPGDGAIVRRDLVIGEDTDGDGLPDAWERMVIANSGGAVTNLSQVGPGRDLDGDGMSDDQEFWYGSFAFLPGDELRVSAMKKAGNRYAFTFLSVLGAVYRVETTPDLVHVAWSACPVALTESGAAEPVEFAGDGQFMTVYIELVAKASSYRLRGR